MDDRTWTGQEAEFRDPLLPGSRVGDESSRNERVRVDVPGQARYDHRSTKPALTELEQGERWPIG